MIACSTLKVGKPCVFMNKKGCSYNGGKCHSIIESCGGCEKIEEFAQVSYCKIFAEPSLKWSTGLCSMATHVERNGQKGDPQKLNPLKASKRSQR